MYSLVPKNPHCGISATCVFTLINLLAFFFLYVCNFSMNLICMHMMYDENLGAKHALQGVARFNMIGIG